MAAGNGCENCAKWTGLRCSRVLVLVLTQAKDGEQAAWSSPSSLGSVHPHSKCCLPSVQVQHRCRVLGSHERGPEKDWVTGVQREGTKQKVHVKCETEADSASRGPASSIFFILVSFILFHSKDIPVWDEISLFRLPKWLSEVLGGVGHLWERGLELGGVWVGFGKDLTRQHWVHKG